jgi:hypothetical protein
MGIKQKASNIDLMLRKHRYKISISDSDWSYKFTCNANLIFKETLSSRFINRSLSLIPWHYCQR